MGDLGEKVAVAAAPQSDRWNLDDVERISRGRPSKAKLGSRAVPHRLNAVERKAFELAKQRGYVVQQANTRRYPLINTYRNYCEALGLPCIRIEQYHPEQGPADSTDEVVVDFTPLHQSEADTDTLRKEVSKAVAALTEKSIADQDGSSSPDTPDESPFQGLSDVVPLESMLSGSLESGSSKPLRFQASSRNEAKLIAQTAVDTWRSLATYRTRKQGDLEAIGSSSAGRDEP